MTFALWHRAFQSTLAAHILRSGLLRPGDRLQLVARGVPSSSSTLLSTRIDLMDAFDDEGVDIELVANIEDIDGDVVVMCAGESLSGNINDRRELGRKNRAVFEEIAGICAEGGSRIFLHDRQQPHLNWP